jgi:hypothetical protein
MGLNKSRKSKISLLGDFLKIKQEYCNYKEYYGYIKNTRIIRYKNNFIDIENHFKGDDILVVENLLIIYNDEQCQVYVVKESVEYLKTLDRLNIQWSNVVDYLYQTATLHTGECEIDDIDGITLSSIMWKTKRVGNKCLMVISNNRKFTGTSVGYFIGNNGVPTQIGMYNEFNGVCYDDEHWYIVNSETLEIVLIGNIGENSINSHTAKVHFVNKDGFTFQLRNEAILLQYNRNDTIGEMGKYKAKAHTIDIYAPDGRLLDTVKSKYATKEIGIITIDIDKEYNLKATVNSAVNEETKYHRTDEPLWRETLNGYMTGKWIINATTL